jgi:hypothetical protein
MMQTQQPAYRLLLTRVIDPTSINVTNPDFTISSGANKMEFLDREEQNLALQPPKGSLREKDNLYYEILGGGARMR